MTTRAPKRSEVRSPARRWRPAAVAATAFTVVLVGLGVGNLVLRNSESPVGDEPAIDTTVAVTVLPTTVVTTIPPTTVVTTIEPPEEPAIAPGVRQLSEQAEYGANLVLGPSGLPVMLSTTTIGDEYPGTARLFRCADIACDDFTVETLEYAFGAGRLVRSYEAASDSFTIGPNDDVFLTLESPGAMLSVGRFADGVVEPLPVLSNWPGNAALPYMPLPCAFDDHGNPVFITYHGALPATANLLVCNDSLCDDFSEIEFDSATFHDQFPEVWVNGGTAHIVYSVGEPAEAIHPEELGMTARTSVVKEVTITDLYDSATVTTETLDSDPRIIGAVDPLGRPVRVFVEVVYDPVEYSAYMEEEQRIADEGLDLGAEVPEPLGANYAVEQCGDPACTSTKRTSIAATDAAWHYLYRDSLSLELAPDGTLVVVLAGAEESWNPGLYLFVFPDGDVGPGVDPIVGHGVIESWGV